MTGDSILSHVEAVDIANAHTKREADLEVSQNSSFMHYYHCATLCINISIAVFLRLL